MGCKVRSSPPTITVFKTLLWLGYAGLRDEDAHALAQMRLAQAASGSEWAR